MPRHRPQTALDPETHPATASSAVSPRETAADFRQRFVKSFTLTKPVRDGTVRKTRLRFPLPLRQRSTMESYATVYQATGREEILKRPTRLTGRRGLSPQLDCAQPCVLWNQTCPCRSPLLPIYFWKCTQQSTRLSTYCQIVRCPSPIGTSVAKACKPKSLHFLYHFTGAIHGMSQVMLPCGNLVTIKDTILHAE